MSTPASRYIDTLELYLNRLRNGEPYEPAAFYNLYFLACDANKPGKANFTAEEQPRWIDVLLALDAMLLAAGQTPVPEERLAELKELLGERERWIAADDLAPAKQKLADRLVQTGILQYIPAVGELKSIYHCPPLVAWSWLRLTAPKRLCNRCRFNSGYYPDTEVELRECAWVCEHCEEGLCEEHRAEHAADSLCELAMKGSLGNPVSRMIAGRTSPELSGRMMRRLDDKQANGDSPTE